MTRDRPGHNHLLNMAGLGTLASPSQAADGLSADRFARDSFLRLLSMPKSPETDDVRSFGQPLLSAGETGRAA
jgi:hypothetical protein